MTAHCFCLIGFDGASRPVLQLLVYLLILLTDVSLAFAGWGIANQSQGAGGIQRAWLKTLRIASQMYDLAFFPRRVQLVGRHCSTKVPGETISALPGLLYRENASGFPPRLIVAFV